MKKLILITLVALVALSSCKKEDEVKVSTQDDGCQMVINKRVTWDSVTGYTYILKLKQHGAEVDANGYIATDDEIVSKETYDKYEDYQMYCE